MYKIKSRKSKTKSGFVQQTTQYQAENCEGCPLRGVCHQSKDNRIVERNHQLEEFKQEVRVNLLSEKGEYCRKKRTADVEPPFAFIKHNRNFKRFTHYAIEKVELEFGLHAIAHNIKRKCA